MVMAMAMTMAMEDFVWLCLKKELLSKNI